MHDVLKLAESGTNKWLWVYQYGDFTNLDPYTGCLNKKRFCVNQFGDFTNLNHFV